MTTSSHKINDILEIKALSYSSDGFAVGRHEGYVIFIDRGIVGEKYRIKLIETGKSYGRGELIEILKTSKNRIPVDCPVYFHCGGCKLRHMTYDEELIFKKQIVNDCLNRIGKLNVETENVMPSPLINGYRNNVQYKIDNGVIGFYREGTHDVVPCDRCLLAPEIFGDTVTSLYKLLSENVTELKLRRSQMTGEILCAVKSKGSLTVNSEALMKIQNLVGVVDCSCQKEKIIYGRNYFYDSILSKQFCISSNTFYQVNSMQIEKLYSLAINFALSGEETIGNVLDLYCGIGTIGICASDYSESITGIDIVSSSIENAKINAKINNVKNSRYLCGDAKNLIESLSRSGYKPDVVFTDPPRSGMDGRTIEILKSLSPKRIIYISCNPATLARDLKKLSESYTIDTVQAVDMFPRTVHVETVVLMSKVKE